MCTANWLISGDWIYNQGTPSITYNSDWYIYVAWSFENTITLWTDILVSKWWSDMFIWKLDSLWNRIRAKSSWWATNDQLNSITHDNVWNIYVWWSFEWTAKFWSTTITSVWWKDAFVWKLDSSWTRLWASGWWSWDPEAINWLEVDSDRGYVYVVGFFNNNATFGTYQLSAAWWADVLVWKLDSSSWNRTRARRWWSSNLDVWYWIEMDNVGSIYVVWYYHAAPTFWAATLWFSWWADAFIAKLDSSWNRLWANKWGWSSYDRWYKVVSDNSNNIYMVWSFNNNATFGTYQLSAVWWTDAFVWKLDSSWNRLWANKWWWAGTDSASDIIMYETDMCVVWYFEDTATFWSKSIISAWNNDVFLWKIDTAWNRLWANNGWWLGNDKWYWLINGWSTKKYIIWTFDTTATFWSISLNWTTNNLFVWEIK